MRYRVKGVEIRSENAAKPHSQASSELVAWLRSHPPSGDVLDYGCGKLRYFPFLAPSSKSLTLVDSDIQITRKQSILGHVTSVREYVRRWRKVRVLSVDQFENDDRKYNFILCSNVLSAIPSPTIRNTVLRRLAKALRPDGRCLLVTQYRNTDFKRMATSRNASAYLDGWLLITDRGAFYYGLIDLAKLTKMIVRSGFFVEEAWIHGESAYVLAGGKQGKPPQ